MQESSFEAAVKKQILDPLGLLYEEPERLFLDELRTSTEVYSILELIGAGCNRISEIAARLGKPAPQLTRSMALMQDLEFICFCRYRIYCRLVRCATHCSTCSYGPH